MFLATIVFWLGRKKFVHIPPAGPGNYVKEIFQPGNLKALGNLLIVVPFAAVFWALWQQNFSSWVVQFKRGGKWSTRILPGSSRSQIIDGELPEAIAIRAVNRVGNAGAAASVSLRK